MKKHSGLMCPTCSDVIFSEHRHDFKYCKCGEIFVDGGYDYMRYGFKDKLPIKVKRLEDGQIEIVLDTKEVK